MLSREENELLTRTGPGAPMGELFRRYWVPALLAEELPAPNGPPIRVRLLGEELVAFRDSAGRVGLVEAHCAHRGASLFFGRNEESGIRCVYHGWKYDVDGQCVDMPNEPSESTFKERIRLTAYPTREAGGVIWAYLGPPSEMSELPQLEWTRVPSSHRYVHKRRQACNYLQNVEGEVDSAHVSFLHRQFNPGQLARMARGQTLLGQATDRAPVFAVNETEYGLLISARRTWDDETYYWRITQFLMPTYTMIPAEPGFPISFTAAIPQDDENLWGYTVTWHPDRSLTEAEVATIESWTGIYAEVVPGSSETVANKANDYRIDRQRQRTESFTGIRGIREQDLAVQEDQWGPLCDRTREHLGTTDAAVIAVRHRLLQAVRDVQHGQGPMEAYRGEAYRVRSAAFLLPRSTPIDDGARSALVASV